MAEVDGSASESNEEVVNEHIRNKRDTVTSRLLDNVTQRRGRRHLRKSLHGDSSSLSNIEALGGGWGLSESGLIWTDVYDGGDS